MFLQGFGSQGSRKNNEVVEHETQLKTGIIEMYLGFKQYRIYLMSIYFNGAYLGTGKDIVLQHLDWNNWQSDTPLRVDLQDNIDYKRHCFISFRFRGYVRRYFICFRFTPM